jgi:hypothetical protein
MNTKKPPLFEPVIPTIERPHSMLFKGGISFTGNKYIDIFRWYIYHFIKITGWLFFKTKNEYKPKSVVGEDKLVFITRDWGKNTTLNKEIYQSLEEYCDDDKVERLVLLRYDDIIKKINEYLDEKAVSHVLLDTRVLINKGHIRGLLGALYNCYRLSRTLKQRNVVCICGMTDMIEPGQRLFAELITSQGGLLVSWGSVGLHEVPNFRHQRIIGSLFCPVSWKTWGEFENVLSGQNEPVDLSIIGLNYEPRKSLIDKLIPELKKAGISVYINTRKDLGYVEYLKMYANSKIGLNTNWVINQPTKLHYTGRNFEIMFAGCFLITQKCYGLDLYMQEGMDYVSFNDNEDLLKKITYYLSHEEERLEIAQSGKRKVRELFATQFIWQEIDKALKIFNYTKLPR